MTSGDSHQPLANLANPSSPSGATEAGLLRTCAIGRGRREFGPFAELFIAAPDTISIWQLFNQDQQCPLLNLSSAEIEEILNSTCIEVPEFIEFIRRKKSFFFFSNIAFNISNSKS